ncbi:MAG: SatD family protein [Clostridiales bacterium]|jgi:hypothetical protein|nr:SatD family protein [Clostridiales bacterium]
MNKETYCAFIADIVESTKMNEEKRRKVQEKIQDTINNFNETYKESIAAQIYFSGGDQLQALFESVSVAYAFACAFREELFPVEFRIGLGVGDWSLRFPGDNTNKQDGTSYHNARSAYEYAHKTGKNIMLKSGRDADAYINVFASQEYAIFNMQSNMQKEAFKKYKEICPIKPAPQKTETGIISVHVDKVSQERIAEAVGTSRQNVGKLLKNGMIHEQRDLQGAIVLMLSRIFDEGKGIN